MSILPKCSIEIDPRSYRVFEREGARLLFDRATASTVGLDEHTFEVLSACQEGLAFDAALTAAGIYSEEDRSAFQGVFEALQQRGFFQYQPVDLEEQDQILEMLWRHRPRRIQLLMAQGCNLGCRYCYAWRNGSNQKGTLMSLEMAKASVDHLVKNSAERINLLVTFFGGEPLLNWEVIQQVVTYCRGLEKVTDKQFDFELITNGTLLTREITDYIVREKFLLFISIDGWEEMHNYNRPSMSGNNEYQNILDNALYANAEYQRAGLNPLKVRANFTKRHHDAQKTGEYLASLGFKVIGLGAIEPLPHGDVSPAALTEDQMDEMMDRHFESLKVCIDKLSRGESLTYFESVQLKKAAGAGEPQKNKGLTCGVARNTAVVDNRGNIYPCHRYEGMEAYIVGNVQTGMDREKTMDYYRKVNRNATDRCHSCWIRDYCAGGCAWLLSAKNGQIVDPTVRECNRRRSSMEMNLWLRQELRTRFPTNPLGGEAELAEWTWEKTGEGFDPDLPPAEAVSGPCGTESKCSTCGPSGCGN